MERLKGSHASELNERNALLSATIEEHRSTHEGTTSSYEMQMIELKNDHHKVLSETQKEHAMKEEMFNNHRVSL